MLRIKLCWMRRVVAVVAVAAVANAVFMDTRVANRCTHGALARRCCFGCCSCIFQRLMQLRTAVPRLQGAGLQACRNPRPTSTPTRRHLGLQASTNEEAGGEQARIAPLNPAGCRHKSPPPRRLCVAPMMDWTDRHDRYFLRRFTKNTWLYTEMVTCSAILGDDYKRNQHLKFFQDEHPVALQLGGADPRDLAKCAAIGESYGYDEINLNVGCPSERVSRTKNSFGACLMASPELVAECVAAMKAVVQIPVTVKHRIGIDDMDSYEQLRNFVQVVEAAGCSTFIVHARKAILSAKLTPKQNREIPPLKYDYVYQLKRDFPHLEIIINGGVTNLEQAQAHLHQGVDGVMIGRSAYYDPFRILASADKIIYGDAGGRDKSREEVIEEMCLYIQEQIDEGEHLNSVTRHMLGLFNGCTGGKAFRRHLSENVHLKGAGAHTLRAAAVLVPVDVRLEVASSPVAPQDARELYMTRSKDELQVG